MGTVCPPPPTPPTRTAGTTAATGRRTSYDELVQTSGNAGWNGRCSIPHDPSRRPPPAPGWRATASRRSSTPPSRCSAEVGYDRLTMDAVATRAKASKATLYRRWTNKLTLVIDALVAQKARPPSRPTPAACAATSRRRTAASAVSPTPRPSAASPASSPPSAATPSSPTPTARQVLGPEDRAAAGDLRAGPGPRRAARRRRHRPDRPGPAGHRPAPLLHARRGRRPRTSSLASSTRSSCPPRPPSRRRG